VAKKLSKRALLAIWFFMWVIMGLLFGCVFGLWVISHYAVQPITINSPTTQYGALGNVLAVKPYTESFNTNIDSWRASIAGKSDLLELDMLW
jgi:hypothetical protein